jgi:hypothetical protein
MRARDIVRLSFSNAEKKHGRPDNTLNSLPKAFHQDLS